MKTIDIEKFVANRIREPKIASTAAEPVVTDLNSSLTRCTACPQQIHQLQRANSLFATTGEVLDREKLRSYNQRASKSFYFLVAIFVFVRILGFVLDLENPNNGYLIFSIFLAVCIFFYNFRPSSDLLFLSQYNSAKGDDLFTFYFKLFCGAVLFYAFMIFTTIFLNFVGQTSSSPRLAEVSKITSFLVLPVLAIIFFPALLRHSRCCALSIKTYSR